MSATVPVPVTFSGLRTACLIGTGTDIGATNISLSDFRNVPFTNGTSLASSGPISILSEFFTSSGLSDPKTFSGGGGSGSGSGSGGGRGGRSDRRLKHNLRFIENSPSGIPIYEFNFKPEYSHLVNDTNLYSVDVSRRYRGVLAQDLLDLGYQDSVFIQDNYYCVKYDEIDVDFVEV
tara:strand:- start:1747 stop:2277 length:531 start_codon:yes stop_codon:yes gene_type:complete